MQAKQIWPFVCFQVFWLTLNPTFSRLDSIPDHSLEILAYPGHAVGLALKMFAILPLASILIFIQPNHCYTLSIDRTSI